MFNFIIRGNKYDSLKRLINPILPAIGTLYFALGSIWGLPAVDKVVGTLTAVTTFLGIVTGISKTNYINSGEAFDGSVSVYQDPEHGLTANADMSQAGDAFLEKDSIRLKVQRTFLNETPEAEDPIDTGLVKPE